MRFLRTGMVGVCMLGALCANAANQVELIFSDGSTRTTDRFTIQSGQVVYGAESLSRPFSQIKSANFIFENDLSVDEFNVSIRLGTYDELISRIDSLLAPVKEGLTLPGNIDLYVQYRMRACFWAGKYDEARAEAKVLQSKNSTYAPLAEAYQILMQLEEGKSVPELAVAYEQNKSLKNIPKAMNEYILGCLAMGDKDYEVALQYFANVLVFYSRDPEWFPAATFNEGLIYKKTGYTESASSVADELRIAYADSHWGVRANELK